MELNPRTWKFTTGVAAAIEILGYLWTPKILQQAPTNILQKKMRGYFQTVPHDNEQKVVRKESNRNSKHSISDSVPRVIGASIGLKKAKEDHRTRVNVADFLQTK